MIDTDRSSDATVGTASTAVVGAGAAGLLYAAAFSRSTVPAKVPTVVVSRQRDVVASLNNGGISVTGVGAAAITGTGGALIAVRPDEVRDEHRREVVVVLARSFESTYAIGVAANLVREDGIVVMLQNGLAGWDCVRRLPGANVSGATYIGAWAAGPNHVVCTRLAQTVIPATAPGLAAPHAARIASLFAATGLPVVFDGDESEVVWQKTLFTTVNWLSAVTGLPAYLVRESDLWRSVLTPVLREAIEVAAVEGVTLDLNDLLARMSDLPSPDGSKGSAYAALERGQPLEILDICDSIIRRAATSGVSVPLTHLLVQISRIQQSAFGSLPRRAIDAPSQA
jgi:2-dehydropantoate 2-reductase